MAEHAASDGSAYLRLARRMLGWRDGAEDACQAAFLKACARPDEIDGDRLAAWLRRVVVNECLQRMRVRRTAERHREGVARRLSDSGVDPTSDSVARDDEVVWLLDRLDPDLRAVVVMRVMEGISGKQTAEALGVSQSVASRRLHRAMTQLRALHRLQEPSHE
ncbi:MAG: sigma-70 family RNA polymerase sigma factor [Planctomycetota bacterium]